MKKILLFVSALFILGACSNDEGPDQPTVFGVGAGYKTLTESKRAIVWKNGKPTYLTNGTKEANAYSLFISNGNVYVAGSEKNAEGNTQARLWKNGSLMKLGGLNATQNSELVSVFVQSGDVYALGKNNGVVKYWKNGVETNVTGIPDASEIKKIAVYGADLCILFSFENSVNLWKNGSVTTLSDGVKADKARSMSYDGGNLYVLAEEEYNGEKKIKYWKNGTVHYLSTVNASLAAYDIDVLEDIVVIAGDNDNYGGYWYDRMRFSVGASSGSTIHAIKKFKDNVYMVGVDGGFKVWDAAKSIYSDSKTLQCEVHSIFVTP